MSEVKHASIEERLAIKRKTDHWPDDAVMIPDLPDPPKINTKICPDCGVPLRKNQDDRDGVGSFSKECPICGCNPY